MTVHCAAFTTSSPLSLRSSVLNGGAISKRVASTTLPRAAPSRRSRVKMAGPDVIEKKSVIINVVKERLEKSEMIFSIPLPGLTVANVSQLKKDLPDGSTAMTVKNTLMRRAVAETQWAVVGDITKQSSIWVFVGDDIKGSVEAYQQFAKSLDRDPVRGGVLEGTLYDTEGVEAIAALPSKIELITKIARAVNMIPTKIARSIKEVPTKTARAIKLAFADEQKNEDKA